MDADVPFAEDPHLRRIESDLEDIAIGAERAATSTLLRLAPLVVGAVVLVIVAWRLGRRSRDRA